MLSVPVMGRCVVGIKFDRPPKLFLSGLPIPVIILDYQSQGGVTFGKVFIDLNRVKRRCPCPWHELSLWLSGITAHQGITISQASIGARIVRILARSLLKIIDGLLETRAGSFVEKIFALEIKVMSFVLLGRQRGLTRGCRRLVLVAECQSNLAGDILCNLLLQNQ